MMGWRMGYIAYMDTHGLADQLLKVQDTIPICPSQLSQYVALAAVKAGRSWVDTQINTIIANK